jgi:hypothetical protein
VKAWLTTSHSAAAFRVLHVARNAVALIGPVAVSSSVSAWVVQKCVYPSDRSRFASKELAGSSTSKVSSVRPTVPPALEVVACMIEFDAARNCAAMSRVDGYEPFSPAATVTCLPAS